MKSLIIDSSSAILLFKSGLFDDVVSHYYVFMPETVYNELIVSGHSGWEDFISVHKKKLIRVIRDLPDNTDPTEDGLLMKMGIGERDAITLFRVVRADFILIDDGRGAKYCRLKHIPFVNALLMAKILLFSKCIDIENYSKAFQNLKSIGRYSADVVEYAETCENSELEYFHASGDSAHHV